MTTLAPCAANALTTAAPMPVLPPVTIATFPSRSPCHDDTSSPRAPGAVSHDLRNLPGLDGCPPPAPPRLACVSDDGGRRQPGGARQLPSHRRLRLLVRLRAQRARRPGRLRRVALPAPARFSECLRCSPRPHRRQLPGRSDQHAGAPPASLHPRNHGPRDDVAHPVGVARGPGPVGDRVNGQRRPPDRLPPRARATSRPPALCCASHGASKVMSSCW